MSEIKDRYLEDGRAILKRLEMAIQSLPAQLDKTFAEAVALIVGCQGHVIVSGAGTSSAVARQIAHLLTCAGAPSLYLDSGESMHGGAAAVTDRDVLLVISKGGETDELNNLARVARQRGAKVIALLSDRQSTLARQSDVIVSFAVDENTDPRGLLPFGSALAAVAVGQALCFAVMNVQGYSEADFLEVHPGGAVGKKLRRKHQP
jgi:arabinose-5-phosphate isomerase